MGDNVEREGDDEKEFDFEAEMLDAVSNLNDDDDADYIDASELSEEELEAVTTGDKVESEPKDDEPPEEKEVDDEASEGESVDEKELESDDSEKDGLEKPVDDGGDKKPDEKEVDPDAEHEEFAEKIGKKETRERFTTVLNEKKEIATELKTLKQEHEQFTQSALKTESDYKALHDGLFSGGLSVQDVSTLIPMHEAIIKGDAKYLTENLPLISDVFNAVELLTGKKLGGLDIVSEYDDLKKKVEFGDIDQEGAEEIARTRKQNEAQENARIAQQNKQTDNHNRQTAAQQVSLENAKALIANQLSMYEDLDAGWAAKKPRIEAAFIEASNQHLEKGGGYQDLPQLLRQAYANDKPPAPKTPVKPSDDTNMLRSTGRKLPNTKEVEVEGNDDWVGDLMRNQK